MERYEIGDDARLASLVDAARRGEEAVFTRDGAEVAKIVPSSLRTRDGREPSRGIDMDALRKLHAKLPPGMKGGGAALINEMRDLDQH